MAKTVSAIKERSEMTLDECLETVPPDVRQAIEHVCDKAGTYDADWALLKAAGEIIASLRASYTRVRRALATAEAQGD